MINVRFVERSLLSGYSYLWVLTQILNPGLWWPHFDKTRNHYCLMDIPYYGAILSGRKWPILRRTLIGRMRRILYVGGFLSVIINIYYLTLTTIITFEVRQKFLEYYGMTKEYELSYKLLYYVPSLSRSTLLLLTLITSKVWPYNSWTIYDKYDIFSLGFATQIKFTALIIIMGLPDAFFELYELNTYLSFSQHSERYYVLYLTHYVRPAFKNQFILSTLIGTFLLTCALLHKVLRFMPLLNIIYSSLCVRRHLRVINNQILMGQQRQRMLSQNQGLLIGSKRKQQQSGYTMSSTLRSLRITKKQEELGDPLTESMLTEGSARTSNSLEPVMRSSTTGSWSLEGLGSSSQVALIRSMDLQSMGDQTNSSGFAGLGSSQRQQQQQSLRSATTLLSSSLFQQTGISKVQVGPDKYIEQGKDHKLPINAPRLCVIQNLRQLELHLTKLEFFVYDLDHRSAALVFLLCIVSLIQVDVSVFFLMEFQRSYMDLLFGILYFASRLLIPFMLFVSGDLMKREAKRLLDEFENIYLKDSSQNLIYKQYSNTISSVARVIKLLGSIEFNCDKLMSISLETMKKFIFYTIAAMFIVVQYDAFNVLYIQSEAAQDLNSSGGGNNSSYH